MKPPRYFKIMPSEEFDYIQFAVDVANGRPVDFMRSQIFSLEQPIFDLRNEFMDYIVKNGLTTYIEIGPINEELTTPRMPMNTVVSILIQFLSSIGIDNELIIIDPYFFPNNSGQYYLTTIIQILSPFLSQLTDLRIITHPQFNHNTKILIENGLHRQQASLRIHHTQTAEIHDRFWISNNRQKGILTGTSLNGLGRKYAIIDHLKNEDVTEIINEFSRRNLI